MKSFFKPIILATALAGLWLADFAPDAPFVPVFPGFAEAVIGRPLTPVSGAGVARRTTRRAVYATSASASAAQQQQAAAQQQQAPQPQQAAPAPAALPPGTVVSALPAGCVSATVDGVSMFNCSGVYYEPKFQSNNLVYVVK